MKEKAYLLTKPRFLSMFVAQFTGAFNDNLFKQGFLLLLTYGSLVSAGSSAIWVNLASACFILPFFLFSALSGELADKYEKSRVLQVVKAVEIALVAFIAYGFYYQSATCLMVALFGFGLHATVYGPAKYAILPELLDREELIAGNAFLESSTFIAILLGMMGSYFITHSLLIVFLLMFTLSIVGFLAALSIPHSKRESPKVKLSFNFIRSTVDVIAHAYSNVPIWRSILGISWFWLIGYILISQFPIFVRDYLHASSIMVNVCLGLFTLGFIAGALMCNRLLSSRVEATYVPVAALGLSIFLVDLAFSAGSFSASDGLITWMQFSFFRFAIDLMGVAFCGGIFSIPLYTILQTRSDDSHRSRDIAANNIMNAAFMLLGSMLYGAFDLVGFDIPLIFLMLAVLNIGVFIITCGLIPDAVAKSVVKWALSAIYRVKVERFDEYPDIDENYLVVANHSSYLDILLLCAFMPDKFTIAINTEVAKYWWVKPFLALADTYAIDPTNPMSTRKIIEQVRSGKKCIIFPEGRLTTTGAIMKIYEGPGMIADKANASIVPIRIDGAQFAFPFSRLDRGYGLKWFPKITLTVLPKVKLDPIEKDISSREKRRLASMRLYQIMLDMTFNASHLDQTIFDAILDARDQYSSGHPIAEDVERKVLSYRQFIFRSVILGNYIRRLHNKGDVVGVMIPTSTMSALIYTAMQYAHLVPAMVNYSTGSANMLHGLRAAGAGKLYTSKKFVELAKLKELIDSLEASGIVIHYLEEVRDSIGIFRKFMGIFSYLFIKPLYRRRMRQTNPNDASTILFTSGSEGMPKAVALSHRNILANCRQVQTSIDLSAKDIAFNALPVFHSFGLTVGTVLPLTAGIKTFFYPSPLHYRIIPELVYDTNATILFGTDTFLNGYARFAHNYDFYSVRYVVAGAEKLKPSTYQLWSERFGVRIFEGYGATETSPVLSGNTPMETKLGTVGRLFPGIEARLEAVDGVKGGGRLFVRGPNVMLGYIDRQQSDGYYGIDSGWYDTGDIVSIDSEGYIKIMDRAKRFAKIGGEMVSLSAVESLGCELWPDAQTVAVSRDDPKKGEAIIMLSTYREANLEDIRKAAKEKGISELFVPKELIVIEELPLLATGKIDYKQVKSLAESYL